MRDDGAALVIHLLLQLLLLALEACYRSAGIGECCPERLLLGNQVADGSVLLTNLFLDLGALPLRFKLFANFLDR